MIIADLHIHGKYSRGCSTELTIPNLEKWARVKGLNLLGTGDFQHPQWLQHIKENLEEKDGLMITKNGFNFMLQTEISLIYTQDGKGRRIHNVVLAPNLRVAEQVQDELGKRGRLDYDGRPIFKIPCPEFTEMMKGISKDIEIIPAHIMTPHFSLFGEYNQFSKVEDCFKDQTKHIHALETGLSADIEMLNRMSQIDKFLFVSFSDLHSFWPWRMGREATMLDVKMDYQSIINTIRTKQGFVQTLEFFPSQGKYHFTGHRKCNLCLEPQEALKHNNICPVCGRMLTIGVAQRIEALADRPEDYVRSDGQKSLHLIPLSDIIAGVLKCGVATKKVWNIYNPLIEKFGSELNILLNVPKEGLLKCGTEAKLTNSIIKNREQKIYVEPGYDGVYGQPMFEESVEKEKLKFKPKQQTLSSF